MTAIYADGVLSDPLQQQNQAEPWTTLFHALALSNDAHLDRHGKVQSEPTEAALLHAALAAGWDKATLEHEAPRWSTKRRASRSCRSIPNASA